MAFEQKKLVKIFNQSRGIFDRWAYRSDTDSIADITAAGYFSASRYADDPDWTVGPAYIDVKAADGFYQVQLVGGVASVVGGGAPVSKNITNSLLKLATTGGALDLGNIEEVELDPDTISIGDGVSVYIKSDSKTKIKSTGNGNGLITLLKGSSLYCDNVKLMDGGFDCGGIIGESNDPLKPITSEFKNGTINVSNGNQDAYRVRGYKEKFHLLNSYIFGNPNPDLNNDIFYLQTLCACPDDGNQAGDRQSIKIDKCNFFGGANQFATFGTDGPPSPIQLTNNNFFDAHIRAIHCYHGEDAVIQGNVVDGVKGFRPTVPMTNIGGAVWLDLYGPAVDGDRRGQVYSNNIIRKCAGVGLFIEEMFGSLTGWTITDTTVFPNGYTYDNGDGYLCAGGFGLLVTGGTKYATVTIRSENNVKGVVVDRTLGVDPTLKIGTIEFVNCHVNENQQEGYLFRNEIKHPRIIGGTCVGNGKQTSNTYDAVGITRDNTQSLSRFTSFGVTYDDQITTLSHRHCIGKDYAGMRVNLKDNIFNSLSEWVNSGGTVTGIIADNECLDDRGFSLSGIDRWFSGNDGYRSEYSDRITMNDASGFIEWTYPALHAGSAARVHATSNTATCTQVVAVRLTDRVQLFCSDSTGNLIDGSITPIDITVTVASGKSRVL